MIKKLIVFMFFVSTLTLTTQQPPPKTNNQSLPHLPPPQQNQTSTDGAPIINNNNYITVHCPMNTSAVNSPNSNVSNASNQDSTTTSSARAHAQTETRNLSVTSSQSNAWSFAFNFRMGNQNPWHKNITDFFKYNKKKLFIGSVISTYSMFFYIAAKGNRYLSNPLLWSAWHKEIPLKTLRSVQHGQLMAELLCTIQQRYLCTTDPINFSIPLSTFMKELAQEEDTLRFYQNVYKWCSRLWIRKLLPFRVKLYKKIGVRLRRIKVLRYHFIKWITQYKIDHNQAFKRATQIVRSTQVSA